MARNDKNRPEWCECPEDLECGEFGCDKCDWIYYQKPKKNEEA